MRHSIIYRFIVRLLKRLQHEKTAPTTIISDGILRNHRMALDPTGDWQKQMIRGSYDAELFSFLERVDCSEKVFYDIGSHVGYHSLMFAKLCGPAGQVYAFEPNPTNAKRIRQNLSLNPDLGNITVHEIAVSDNSGQMTFLSSSDIEGGTSSGGFIDGAATLWSRTDYVEKTGYQESTVTTNTIDSLIAKEGLKAPDILKIDVEGAEALVLKGADHTLSTVKPLIIVEFHSIIATYASMDILVSHHYTTKILKQEADGRLLIAALPSTH